MPGQAAPEPENPKADPAATAAEASGEAAVSGSEDRPPAPGRAGEERQAEAAANEGAVAAVAATMLGI